MEHIGKCGASSEDFLLKKFSISRTTLNTLQDNKFLFRQSLDVRHLTAPEGVWTLKQKAKSLQVKGSYMTGEPTRNEIPTLLYLEESLEVIRTKYKIVGEVSERKIKGQKAREANIPAPAHNFTAGITPEGAEARLAIMHGEAPDYRIVYKQSEDAPIQTLNIEIHGCYYGVQLRDKIEAFMKEPHPTLWIVPQSRRVAAHVQKFVDLYGTSKIMVKHIDDLKDLQP